MVAVSRERKVTCGGPGLRDKTETQRSLADCCGNAVLAVARWSSVGLRNFLVLKKNEGVSHGEDVELRTQYLTLEICV